MEPWLILVPLASAFLSGVANVAGKEIEVHVQPEPFAAVSFAWIFLWTAPVGILFYAFETSVATVALLGLIVALDAAANYCYFKGLQVVDASDVSALGALAPLFTALFAVVLLPGAATVTVVVAAAAISVAVYSIAVEDGLHAPLESVRAGAAWPLASGLLFGLSAIPMKLVLDGPTGAPTLYWLRCGLLAVVLLALFRPGRGDVRGYGTGIAAWSLVIGGAWLLYFVAVELMNVVVAAALVYTSPVFTMLLAREELGERITLRRVVAIAVILASIVLVQL